MKKKFSTSELGSMMIEAMAMLALIALVTPILYRKTAERTTELQDINTAGELRAIIKAVDDYVAANYDAIANGQIVTNSCTAGSHQTQDYAALKNKTEASVSVPIGHFCEFLPYGILDASGNAKQSRLFSSNYQVVLKLKGSATSSADKGDKVITSFVITEPNTDIPEIRSSSIASMIGGNGGYVTSTSGSGDSATGEISGNLGIWGISNTKTELGVSVTKNAVVAASIQGISAQSAKIDISGVLYRVKQGGDVDLNTMSTDLYMGQHGTTTRHNITNIGKMIVGSEESGANDKLYIASGDIKIGGAGNITMGGAGNLTMTKGDINVTEGNLTLSKGQATISGDLSADAGTFTVANNGATKALNFATNDDNIKLNIDNKSIIKQPLEVNGCEKSNEYAFCVKGNSHFEGNVTITDTFDAKNLHASEKLTVGGDTAGEGKTLSVAYTNENKGELNFGTDLLKVEKTAANTGSLDFGGSLLKVDTTAAKTGTVAVADDLMKLDTTNKSLKVVSTTSEILAGDAAKLTMENNKSLLQSNANNFLELGADNAKLTASNTIELNSETFKITKQTGGKKDKIESTIDSFTVNAPNSAKLDLKADNKLEVATAQVDFNAGETRREFNVKNMDVHVKAGNTETDFMRMSNNGTGTAQIDMNNLGVYMHQQDTTNEKILKIDLATAPSNTDSYPVYIRKGAIELTADVDTANHSDNNYVKADRFVANTPINGGLVNGETSDRYEINPAYTSVMHDIKLTTRGGARLSDVLPDFINKGIYVVDNTYPAKGTTGGSSLSGYFGKTRDQKNAVATLTSLSDEASPWAGFVPTPTCPPGYAKVITFTPASFAMAQAGYPQSQPGSHKDLHQNYSYSGPLNTPEASPVPLYAQKNTWLKSFVKTYGTPFEGWDVGFGFIYPYNQYKSYITTNTGVSLGDFDTSGSGNSTIIWNMFPVYAGTLEGYATVYCYFNRGSNTFNASMVDKTYDQISSFRAWNAKTNDTYTSRLNSANSGLNNW